VERSDLLRRAKEGIARRLQGADAWINGIAVRSNLCGEVIRLRTV
jgi:hypothetical protein